MVFAASVRGEVSGVLGGAFSDCEVLTGHGATTIRFTPERLREVLDLIQDFGLDLVCLRLCTDPATIPTQHDLEHLVSAQRAAIDAFVQQRVVEISVKGELDAAWLEELDDVAVTNDRGVTRLRALVRDDSALYAQLERLQGSGLEVLAVYPTGEPPPPSFDRRSPHQW